MASTEALVLVSGGIDSCVTAAIAEQNYNCSFLHFNYRQHTENKEKKAFTEIADFYNVEETHIIDLPALKEIGGSTIIQGETSGRDKNVESNNYVPFRNGVFLSYASGLAEVNDIPRIFLGVMEEDSSGYPDCREEFIAYMEEAIRRGTQTEIEVQIETPIIHQSKAEVIKLGKKLDAPLEFTWSCYYTDEKACGECPSCQLRLKAFKEANFKDPISYKKSKA